MKLWTALFSLAMITMLQACSEDATGSDLLASKASSAAAPIVVSESFGMPLRAVTLANVSGCDNSPGPYITLQGEIALGGLGTRMLFTNNVKGTHQHTEVGRAELVVVPTGESIVLPKQPVQGGVGGNPFIWIKFENERGESLSQEIYLGRCVQGLQRNVTLDFSGLAEAIAQLAVADCANSPGPYITLDGRLELRSGLDAKLIFRNNDNPVDGPHEASADAVVRVRLLPPGEVITFPKQPVRGGVGGNPWIWFGFLDGQGEAIAEAELIGRCEQLSKSS
jgi:hypothetical protein